MLVFENVRHAWLWGLLIAGGVAFLLHTYTAIFRRSERRLTWSLMVLRGAGLLALLLALAKPTWTRDAAIIEPGHLGVILDDSASMSLRDPTGKTRYERARELVQRLIPDVEGRPGPEVRVDLFDVSGRPVAAGRLPESPRAERTDLARALGETVRQLRSNELVGVLLISDGVDNSGEQGTTGLDQLGTPIYTVGFDPDPSAASYDLSVRRVNAPERTMVNNDTTVEVLVAKSGEPEADAQVVIRRGRQDFAVQSVHLPRGEADQRVSMTIRATEPGSFVFTAAVTGNADERLLTNNAQHFPLRVDAEPIRVFYIEGFLRWEYTYLRRQLEADPDVSAVTVVRRPNPESGSGAAPPDLITPEQLDKFDVVILGDMEASYLTPAEYRAIVEWIDAGKSLLVLGGYRSFGPDGFRTSPLADALPVIFSESDATQSEDPFVIGLTEAGRDHPIFRVTGDRVQDAALWAASSPLAGCSVVATEKPGASVLAVAPRGGAVKPLIVMAVERYGQGHSAVLTADTTWRWTRLPRALGQPDTLYARFWGQTVRWLAGKEPIDQEPALVVSTDQPAYDAGKQVTIRVARQARPGQNSGEDELSVEVADEAGQPVGVAMSSSSAEPDAASGVFYPSAGGRYAVRASLRRAGRDTANQTAEFLVHGSGLELADTGTRKEFLRDLATRSGGLYWDINQANGLAERIERRERRIERVLRSELWDSPVLFLTFLAAVTAEWVIRRRNHLV